MRADSPLLDAVRRGDYRAARRLVLAADRERLRADAPRVRGLHRAIGAVAHGDVSPDGAWVGPSGDHYECATLALMACTGADRAARLAYPTPRVAAELPALFPDDLEHVASVWCELFQRSPKNWDRNAFYSEMFDWVRRGLVPAPTSDGGVNLFLSELAQSGRRYPPGAYPSLYAVTLPLLFTAAVRPSLGAAAIDVQLPPGDPRRVDEQVLRLVRRGVWTADDVRAGIERGLAVRESPFQRRWLLALRDRVG